MELIIRNKFYKNLRKLPKEIQLKVFNTLKIFQNNPNELLLRNHPLHGKLKDIRSISVTGNLRILFKEENNYEKVTLGNIGTHNQLY